MYREKSWAATSRGCVRTILSRTAGSRHVTFDDDAALAVVRPSSQLKRAVEDGPSCSSRSSARVRTQESQFPVAP